MKFEQPPQKTPLEHKDISGERRPKYSVEVSGRARAEFFFGLMEETLRNYDEARKQNLEKEKSPFQNMEFFFKKSWDNFTEPVLEYEDMLAEIITKQWESNGAKSRALNSLKEQRAKVVENLKIVMPDFEELDAAEQKKAVAKLYEGYAGFISEKEEQLEQFSGDADRDFSFELRSFLRTKNDTLLKSDMEELLNKKKRQKEARRAHKTQEISSPKE
ncbi:hypothetical protein A2819_00065 [Candidatus Azambacteria bacterium RIFCSPHIGHO2_01_FULL_40_24]|uniref:Uncharacterized protein n=1 Tax=Candidatus Azambacteria bacterium RIFCSPHIGHO2_01_FULL_40_24 TaxID=1797301 RepID=A0A1F5B3Q5_9BACT|nr:MAG: hypothetical protein A2819_00065 [Candidatus Azambacteria bacterium RIFCSPHIGHO2_01_FULL_40_24]